MKHLFEGQYKQTSAMLSGRPAAKAELIIRIKAKTVGLALFHSLGSIAHIMPQKDVSQIFFWASRRLHIQPESAKKPPPNISSSSRCVVCVFRVEHVGNSCS